jgi:ribonuclease HI
LNVDCFDADINKRFPEGGKIMLWTVHTDGGCRDNPGPGAWGFVINKEAGEVEEHSGFLPHCTNNQAEYRSLEAALITIALKPVDQMPTSVEIFSDSQLIVEQINGRWRVNELILPYYQTAKVAFIQLQGICPVSLSWIRREFNSEADALCNQVMDKRGIVCSRKGRRRD